MMPQGAHDSVGHKGWIAVHVLTWFAMSTIGMSPDSGGPPSEGERIGCLRLIQS